MLSRREFLKIWGALSIHQFAQYFRFPQNRRNDTRSDLPNIIILVLDTLSATRMSLYGCNRETTPNIQRLATRSYVYHRHYASGNFTTPGTASLLTGTYPWSNRGFNMYGSIKKEYVIYNIFKALPDNFYKFSYTQNPLAMIFLDQFKDWIDEVPEISETCLSSKTITDYFQEDFQSAFWGETILQGRDNSYLPSILFLSVVEKLRQAIEQAFPQKNLMTLYPRGIPHNYQGTTFILGEAIDWLQEKITELPKPFFSYIHLWPPHEPYWPRKDFVEIFKLDPTHQSYPDHHFSAKKTPQELERAQRDYDSYLAYTDMEVGRLFQSLKQQSVFDNTVFILTSDHGQAFEKGIEGHLTPVLFESLIQIPLLISMPGQTERKDIMSPTSAIDVLPTLLNICNQPVPDWCEGQILPGFTNLGLENDRKIFALEAKGNTKFGPITKGSLAMVSGDYKIIRYIGYKDYQDITECYHLGNDPDEIINLYPDDPTSRALKEIIDQKIIEINRPYTS